MCASNIGNAFPIIWQDTMSILQDQCPPKDFAIVKSIIESEYGKPLNDVFSTFEHETIGAASIGQVHRATLLDGRPYVFIFSKNVNLSVCGEYSENVSTYICIVHARIIHIVGW
jgi:hypothetical protein